MNVLSLDGGLTAAGRCMKSIRKESVLSGKLVRVPVYDITSQPKNRKGQKAGEEM